jgi:predicted amidohydrolase YtcJ
MSPAAGPVLLLTNGAIHTLDAATPGATTIALDLTSGLVLAAGDISLAREYAGTRTTTIDLKGRAVLPGFIDAHTHVLQYAQAQREVDLTGTRSEDEAAARVAQAVARTPAGAWIVGRHWDASLWPLARFPTRASLDVVAPDRPVALTNYDYHSAWVNAAALRLAGITRDTPEPADGAVGRDADGEPNGLLFEDGGLRLLYRAQLQARDEATDLAILRAALVEFAGRGITGIHDIQDEYCLGLLRQLRGDQALPLRVLYFLRKQSLPDVVARGLHADDGDDYLRFGGIKFFADGALSSRTAAMFEPFEGQSENRGLLTTSGAEMSAAASQAVEGALGLAIHAIGDRAVHTALDAIEHGLTRWEAAKESSAAGAPRQRPRFRLEHVQLATPDDIARMARLGVVASVQPFHAVADRDKADRYWGARAERSYAYRTLRDAGVRLAFGSDAPVDIFDPLRILQAAATSANDRQPDRPAWHPDQRVPLASAIDAYTAGSAYAGGQERRQGRLTPGAYADLIVLNEDPFTVPPERVAGLHVDATMVGGQVVVGAVE